MKLRYGLILAIILIPTLASACVWGGFDASRVNYDGAVLATGNHTGLRALIIDAGGSLADPTSELTEAYLSGVDVFYTSLLSTDTGTLSPSEQDALHGWIEDGGTLIVTADIFPLAAYESFTAYYGVTNYDDLGNVGSGSIVNAHEITVGVSSFYYNTEATFTYGADALLLGVGVGGADWMIVMEPETGFNVGGRIFVAGDHNCFTDSYIGSDDNTTLAGNFVTWACTGTTAIQSSSWSTVKSLF